MTVHGGLTPVKNILESLKNFFLTAKLTLRNVHIKYVIAGIFIRSILYVVLGILVI